MFLVLLLLAHFWFCTSFNLLHFPFQLISTSHAQQCWCLMGLFLSLGDYWLLCIGVQLYFRCVLVSELYDFYFLCVVTMWTVWRILCCTLCSKHQHHHKLWSSDILCITQPTKKPLNFVVLPSVVAILYFFPFAFLPFTTPQQTSLHVKFKLKILNVLVRWQVCQFQYFHKQINNRLSHINLLFRWNLKYQ